MNNTDWESAARRVDFRIRDFIDGKGIDCDSSESLTKDSPRNGQALYEVGCGSPAAADRAVASARRAHEDGRWSDQSLQDRKTVLFRLVALMDAQRPELALLESLDVGKPIAEALSVDVPLAISVIRYNAECADKLFGQVHSPDARTLCYQLHKPIGVVAAIVGWNFPLLLSALKVGPALAMGNVDPRIVAVMAGNRRAIRSGSASKPLNKTRATKNTATALASVIVVTSIWALVHLNLSLRSFAHDFNEGPRAHRDDDGVLVRSE